MTQPKFVMPLHCVGTRQRPGCGKPFVATNRHPRFCPQCAKLDRKSSYIFAERRELAKLLREAVGK